MKDWRNGKRKRKFSRPPLPGKARTPAGKRGYMRNNGRLRPFLSAFLGQIRNRFSGGGKYV
jgi:hypothetical protein